jgi:hypothetical protein
MIKGWSAWSKSISDAAWVKITDENKLICETGLRLTFLSDIQNHSNKY